MVRSRDLPRSRSVSPEIPRDLPMYLPTSPNVSPDISQVRVSGDKMIALEHLLPIVRRAPPAPPARALRSSRQAARVASGGEAARASGSGKETSVSSDGEAPVTMVFCRGVQSARAVQYRLENAGMRVVGALD